MSTRRRIKACRVASLVLLVALLGAAQSYSGGTPATGGASQAMSSRYEDLRWQTMVPELGNDSPQISILRIDPKTNATQLLIRTPKKDARPHALAQRERNPHHDSGDRRL